MFAAAVGLYLPTARYEFVQDDRIVVLNNPAVHSIGGALAALDDAYWPPPSRAGAYRPMPILTYAADWLLAGGRPGWFHVVNALWHGVACVLVVLVLARWLPGVGALVAGLVFAVHPVHVEAVANVVGRAELMVAVGMLGAILAARRGWWVGTVACAALAVFSKEHGVVTPVLILLDDWLQDRRSLRYPRGLYVALGVLVVAYLGLWVQISLSTFGGRSAVFIERGTVGRLAVALPAILEAARLLVSPLELAMDYSPQVIPAYRGFSLAALGGLAVVAGLPALAWRAREREPAVSFAAAAAALAFLPSSNLLFSSGIVLAERTLYIPVLLVAVGAGLACGRAAARWPVRRIALGAAVVLALLAARSFARLPAWESNKTSLLMFLQDHPESYRAHFWAANIYLSLPDTAGARREYDRALALFDGDPSLLAHRAFYGVGVGETTGVAALIERALTLKRTEPVAYRAWFLLQLDRGDTAGARAVRDTAVRRNPWDREWYLNFPQ